MTTKLIIIVGASIAVVVGMFVMGKFLDKTGTEESQPKNEKN